MCGRYLEPWRATSPQLGTKKTAQYYQGPSSTGTTIHAVHCVLGHGGKLLTLDYKALLMDIFLASASNQPQTAVCWPEEARAVWHLFKGHLALAAVPLLQKLAGQNKVAAPPLRGGLQHHNMTESCQPLLACAYLVLQLV